MQPIIDADTHIAESAAMWQMIDKEMYPRRPVLLSLPDDTLYGGWNATWLIDGNIFPKPVGKGGFRSSPHRRRRSNRTEKTFRSRAES